MCFLGFFYCFSSSLFLRDAANDLVFNHSRGSVREDALTSIIQTFNQQIEYEFVENK